jgi:hypothetical protein
MPCCFAPSELGGVFGQFSRASPYAELGQAVGLKRWYVSAVDLKRWYVSAVDLKRWYVRTVGLKSCYASAVGLIGSNPRKVTVDFDGSGTLRLFLQLVV